MTSVPEGSAWDEGVSIPSFAPLSENATADIVIVGGGLAGILAAYLVSETNKNIILVEQDKIAWGATGVTTGFLLEYIDTELTELIKTIGVEKTKGILESHKAAIDLVEDIVKREQIDCEFMRRSAYVFSSSKKETKTLEEEVEAGKQVGLSLSVQKNGSFPFEHDAYIELSNQAKFHPLKFIQGLVGALQKRGVKIYEHTKVEEMTPGEMILLKTNTNNTLRAHKVYSATYAPLQRKLFFKKALYTSYVYELATEKGAVPEAMYEDTGNPYHYFRVDRLSDKDRVIFGGEDHRSDFPIHPEKNFRALEDHIKKVFSSVPYTIVRRWKGPIMESIDGKAWIGPHTEKNVFYATGFSGSGMTYSGIAAMMFQDFVKGTQMRWADIYNPSRTPTLLQLMYKGRDYSGEMIGGAIKNTFKF